MSKETKTIGLLTREKIVNEIKEKAKDVSGCFFISFNKLPAYPFNTLRNNLVDCGAKVFVTKNTLFQKALKEIGWDTAALLDTETGLVLVYDQDVVGVCKALVQFSQEFESLQLKGGLINDKPVSVNEIKSIAKLPSREAVLGMAVSGIASPLTGFLNALNQIILKFVWVVDEIKKKKENKA
ncbi:MAG: 50S ribosomal protein L10 [Candidatus Omnitrophica bacterium]|nr:50S ribosomal protein L10 [Candidatus Omnitrophota bacterium]